MSTIDGARSRLRGADVAESDFLPGSVAGGWALRTSEPAELLVKEHVGRRALAHPAAVEAGPEEDGRWSAVAATRPLTRWPVAVRQEDTGWVAEDGGRPAHDFSPVRAYWRRLLGVGPWPVEDLYLGLAGHFVKDVICVDPEAMSRLRGRSCLYLANHQVGVESMLFSMLASALSGTPTLTLAKLEHRQSWIGRLIAHNFSYPGVRDPGLIAFFDREDRSALPLIIRELGEEIRTRGKSILVHVEGTRSLSCRAKVEKMSSAFIDLAVGAGVPIVPVRFSGGLPAEALPARIEFPVGHGRQDYWIGGPLMPETLGALPYADRRRAVLDAINGLGPGAGAEEPHPPDPALAEAAADWSRRTGASPEHATLLASLQDLRQPSPEIQALLEGARRGRLETGADPAGRWLAHLARDLFGPRGPRVDAGGET